MFKLFYFSAVSEECAELSTNISEKAHTNSDAEDELMNLNSVN